MVVSRGQVDGNILDRFGYNLVKELIH